MGAVSLVRGPWSMSRNATRTSALLLLLPYCSVAVAFCGFGASHCPVALGPQALFASTAFRPRSPAVAFLRAVHTPPLLSARHPQHRRSCDLAASGGQTDADDGFQWSGNAGAPAAQSLQVLSLAWASDQATPDATEGTEDLTSPADNSVDVLSELLIEMGALSVVIENEEFRDSGMRAQWGSVGWGWGDVTDLESGTDEQRQELHDCTVSAYFAAGHDVAGVIETVVACMSLPAAPPHSITDVANEWSGPESEASWPPVLIADDFVVRYPWHSDEDVSALTAGGGDLSGPSPFSYQLVIDAGAAWGTGEHATTRLSCAWLRRHLGSSETRSRVLDFGAGSGLLGMAAILFGAVEAVGVEIQEEAVENANRNAARNALPFRCVLPSQVHVC